MPRQKKPSMLQDLALTALENVILDTGSYISCLVCSCYTYKEEFEIQPKKKSQSLRKRPFHYLHMKQWCLQRFINKEILPWIQDAINSVPHQFGNKITRDLTEFNNKMTIEHSLLDPEMTHQACYSWMENFIKSCIHNSVLVLNLNNLTSYIQGVVCSKLHECSKLQALLLPSDQLFSFTCKIEKAILHLENLTFFSFQWDCNDLILSQVSRCCKGLKSLDVSYSANVTKASIPHIQRLQSLQSLNVNRTTLSQDSILSLLDGLPFLETINSPDSIILETQQVFPCLQSIAITAEISAIPNMCPNITHLSICPDTYTDDTLILGQLKALKYLEIDNCSFEVSNIKGLLQMIGKNLLSLELKMVDDINAELISNTCTNLKELTYNCCTFNKMLTSFSILDDDSHYDNVLKLILNVHKKDKQLLEFPILNYNNLDKLCIDGMKTFNDDQINTVISMNCLKQLKTLNINNCGNLTLRCLIMLVEHCENLLELSGNYKHSTLNGMVYSNLENYIRSNNYDVKLL